MQRIRRWPYPFHTNNTQQIAEYLQELHQELERESIARVEDFRQAYDEMRRYCFMLGSI